MSKKKRDSGATMPASSAGLMRFFQDEAHGVKIKPEVVVVGSVMLIIVVILAHMLIPTVPI